MFTGIIKAKGSITALERRGGDVRLSIHSTGLPFSTYEVGESIAVNGVCLTAVALRDDGFDTDVSTETLDVTGLGGLAVGSAVNLEPSLALGERLGGHLVSGHVDCVGEVVKREPDARSMRLGFTMPEASASTSRLTFSVSRRYRSSPTSTRAPSAMYHSSTTPSVMFIPTLTR